MSVCVKIAVLAVLVALGCQIVTGRTPCLPCSEIKVRCLYLTADNCTSSEMFVPRDGVCRCCDSCEPKECPGLCERVRCAPKKPEECETNEFFKPRDGDCYCCDTCVQKDEPVPCGNNFCALVDCAMKKPVCSETEVFQPRDGVRYCCDTCVPKPVRHFPGHKTKLCPGLCERVRCANKTPKDCGKNQVFQPQDGDCHCCNTCVQKPADSEDKPTPNCNPDLCASTQCLRLDPEDCDKDTEIYVPADGICRCCNACVPKDNTTNGCPPDLCARTLCARVDPEDCNSKTEIFKRGDGVCNCCNRCVPTDNVTTECPPDLCARTLCARVEPEDCNCETEIFRPRDGVCNCCDACVPKENTTIVPDKPTTECPPDRCALSLCAKVDPEDCNAKTEIFKRGDGVCNCCDRCVPKD